MRKLLEVLHRLTDLGNSIVIIEHNLDVIRNADWILDLGPEGGEDGGYLVSEGRPIHVARTPGSYTGKFLARYYASHQGKLTPVDDTAASRALDDTPVAAAKGEKTAFVPRKKKTGVPEASATPPAPARKRAVKKKPVAQ